MYEKKFHDGNLNFTFLITGGAGFIGSHIVEYLLRYNARKVIVLDNFSTGFRKNLKAFDDNPALEIVEGDIRDYNLVKNLVEQSDYISHQAALGSVPRSIEDPLTTNQVNINGFLNVLTAFKNASRPKRMIYAASSSTYGDSTQLPKRENNTGNPLSPYAVTKLVNELYAGVFGKLYGTRTIGLRYFNIFGPRQDPNGAYAAVIPLFMKAVITGKRPVINGDGLQTRDFTFVENAVQANIRAFFASENAVNQVYNIAVGKRTSLLRLLEKIAALAQKKAHPEFGPARPGDVRDSLADISKAQKLLSYSDLVPLEEGLKITYEYFKNIFQENSPH